MNKVNVLILHKDSSKYIHLIEVPESEITEMAHKAMETFKKGLTDPDITADRIVIVKLTVGSQVIDSTQLDFIINPPKDRPVTITTHTR